MCIPLNAKKNDQKQQNKPEYTESICPSASTEGDQYQNFLTWAQRSQPVNIFTRMKALQTRLRFTKTKYCNATPTRDIN